MLYHKVLLHLVQTSCHLFLLAHDKVATLPLPAYPCTMSHLWKIEDFLAEITHLQELSARRPGSPVVQTLLNTLCQRLRAVNTWTSEAILQLLDHVEAANMPETEKTTLNQCVESLAAAGTNHALALVHGGQKVHNLPAYLTSQDWSKLEADVTVMDLLTVLANRLAHMSVVSLKEHTKQQAVALVLKLRNDQGKPEMTPHAMHNLQKDFQALRKAATQGVAPGNGTYPPRPMDLAENWLQAAYGNDRPECRQIPLAAWMKKAPVRNTNLLLHGTTGKTNAKALPHMQQDSVAQPAHALLQAHQSQVQPQVSFATQAATSQQEVLNQRPVATPMTQALPLTNEPTANTPVPLANEQLVPCQENQQASKTTGPTLEELEADAYKTIASKKKTTGLKRPAARQPTPKPKCKAKAVPTKTPATSKDKAAPKGKAKQPGMGLGCSKCRGDGCSQCAKPNFKGQIYPGRAAWEAAFGKKK